MPFKPKGETAQWRIVYDLFKHTPVDDVITYEALGDQLGMHPRSDRHRIQAAARRAGAHLLTTDDRAIEVIPEQGYKLVPATRQIPLAGRQVEKASNALDRGHDLTSHIRLDELTEQERQVVHAMSLGFAQVAQWARQVGRRVEEHEGRLADIEAELARLREKPN